MKSVIRYAVAAAAVLCVNAAALSSQAAVFIGLRQTGINGGAITTVASGPTFAIYTAGYGSFELELLIGSQGVDPTLLGSTTNDHNSKGKGGILDIFVTRTDIAGPVPYAFQSSFTSNVLPAKWSVLQSTYVSPTNQLYGGTMLSSHLFTTIGTFVHEVDFAGGQVGPYSVTTKYTLNAPTLGGALSTIAIHDASVPEPSAWALMITGFGAAGAMLRRRRQLAVTA